MIAVPTSYDLVGMDKPGAPGQQQLQREWRCFDHIIVSRSLVWPEHKATCMLFRRHRRRPSSPSSHHPKNRDQPNRTFSGHSAYHADGFSDN